MPIASLHFRKGFSASHRLHSDTLSDQENLRLFDKCNRPNGHGHNYMLEVVVKGPIDSTGLVMHTAELEGAIETHVMQKIDHRHLNLDVPEFKTLNPTVENIAVVIWGWLKPVLGARLYEVRVDETNDTTASYRGE